MDVFDIYERLWHLAQAKGASVNYYDWPRADPPSLTADESGASGWFHANHDNGGQPVIRIYRLECDDDSFSPSRTRGPGGAHLTPPDLFEELTTLAHEFGHMMSFLERTARPEWLLYDATARRRGEIMTASVNDMPENLSPAEAGERIRAALHDGLSDDERARIVREEALAWQVGREILRELGLDDFRIFDQHERLGLHAHRYRLGMDDAWPEDESAPSVE